MPRATARSCPTRIVFVSFMVEQRDVTSQVESLIKGKSNFAQEAIIDSLTSAMTDSVRKTDPSLHVEIDPFYEGNKFYATTYQEFDDVRLVFTVPKSMGKYGGETDNWMWPRQTCDFSVFRIYADPTTGGPAKYSKDNVPYHPKHWAPVSLQGYQDGDFAMTVGYPGSTSRYLSSYGIQERRDMVNTPRVDVRDVKQKIMERYMAADEKTRINYEDAYVGSANYWKNSIGMNKCIDSIGIVQQKQDYEMRIAQWQKSTKQHIDKVDFPALKRLYASRAEGTRAQMYWGECFFRTSEFFRRAIKSTHAKVVNPGDKEEKQYFEFDDNSDKWNLALDKEMTAAMLKKYDEQVDDSYKPEFYETIHKDFDGDYTKYTEYLYKESKLLKEGAKFYPASKKSQKDPGLALGSALMSTFTLINMQTTPYNDSIQAEEKKLCAAKIHMEEDLPHYSDANFTMRLSYGQVGGYMIGSYNSGYYTTPNTILEKMQRGDKVADYYAEPIMHQLLGATDFGRYADKDSKTLQLCFLTNNDITGGNSGSPMFDGNGRLIGLAFDGNWDSLSSDINFDRNLARTIGVDIRFVLYMMDKWGHADRLLQEINPQ